MLENGLKMKNYGMIYRNWKMKEKFPLIFVSFHGRGLSHLSIIIRSWNYTSPVEKLESYSFLSTSTLWEWRQTVTFVSELIMKLSTKSYRMSSVMKSIGFHNLRTTPIDKKCASLQQNICGYRKKRKKGRK